MGVEPLAQIEEWKNLVGASYPLYIKNKRFGPAKVTLKTVNVSDVITDNSGTILSCAMAFSFEEYTKPVPTSSSSSGSSGSDDSTGPDPNGKAAQVFNAVSAERQMAMSATASAEDKAAKDPARHDTGH